MMTNDPHFNYCVPVILKLEGGYVNDPQDPGGETNFGISKRAYPDVDIKGLTAETASVIYYNDYWVKFRCADVPPYLDLWFFNACVMSGGDTATKILQQLAGVAQDGTFGSLTFEAVQKLPNVRHHEYLALYALYLMGLKGWRRDGHGWLNRLFQIAGL